MARLVKLKDHFYVVDAESKIKRGSVFKHPDGTLSRALQNLDGRGLCLVTHSTEELSDVKLLDLTKVESFVLEDAKRENGLIKEPLGALYDILTCDDLDEEEKVENCKSYIKNFFENLEKVSKVEWEISLDILSKF